MRQMAVHPRFEILTQSRQVTNLFSSALDAAQKSSYLCILEKRGADLHAGVARAGNSAVPMFGDCAGISRSTFPFTTSGYQRAARRDVLTAGFFFPPIYPLN
jgi:hypothetical protein